jgi:hypothetical protein
LRRTSSLFAAIILRSASPTAFSSAFARKKRDVGLVQREVEKVGRCTFNPEKQVDSCDLKLIHSDGSILAGTAEIR